MKRKHDVRVWILLLVLGCVPLSGKAVQQDRKYRLKDTVAVGDVVEETASFKMKFNVRASADGQEPFDGGFASTEETAYTATVLSLGPKGQATGKRIRYSRYRTTDREGDGKPKTTVSTAEGKTITLRRSGGRTTVSVEKGRISARDREALAGKLDDDEFRPYPEHELAIGEEWSLDSPSFAKAFGASGQAKVSGRLIERIQRSGHPCLRAAMKIDVTCRPKGQPFDMTMQLEGDVYYALDLKRTISVALSGPVTLSGETTESGQKITLTGKGTAEARFADRWVRANGKRIGP